MLVREIQARLKDVDPDAPILVQVGSDAMFMAIIGVTTYADRVQDWSEQDKIDNVESDDLGNDMTENCVLIRVD